jgi:nucleoid DNA-binding protein
MDKRQLVQTAARQSSLTKRQLGEAVDVIFAIIADALTNGDTVVLRDFGRFSTQVHPPYHIKQVGTGSPCLVESRPLPVFRSSAALRRKLKEEHP